MRRSRASIALPVAPHDRSAQREGAPVNEPIVVWGGGAIGGTLAAYWARAGIPVLLVDIVREHVEACRTTGIHIEGPVEESRRSSRQRRRAKSKAHAHRRVKAQATGRHCRCCPPRPTASCSPA
jgi:UDP-N-acetyl-D-mannosaminuronate dehydrogenase